MPRVTSKGREDLPAELQPLWDRMAGYGDFEYSIAVTNQWSRTRDEIFGRLRRHFSEPQLVEMTWRIALCGAFNRFNDILQVEDATPKAAG